MPSLPRIDGVSIAHLALCSALLCLACGKAPQDTGEAAHQRIASKALLATVPGTWNSTGSLASARDSHTATLLPSGKVLVAGGEDFTGRLASAEVYDPATGAWSPTGPLASARDLHTATLLPSGKVLVAGGIGSSGRLASAEVYDPATGTWSPTGSLGSARDSHTATLLPSGKVLVVGGYDGNILAGAEVYDPDTGTWTLTGSLASARVGHTATLLPSGKVLVVGGYDGNTLASAEVYDPDTGVWSLTGPLASAHYRHTATLLPSGRVLISGSWSSSGALASAEVYDPATGTWNPTDPLASARDLHTTTLLPSGKVLVTGGVGSGDLPLASAEVYDPDTGAWNPTGPLASARYAHTATLLPSGKVLVAGGTGSSVFLASAEIYEPPPATPTITAPDPFVNTSKPAIAGTAGPSNTVLIWLDGTLAVTTQADAQGQWAFTPSTPLSEGLHQVWGVARNEAGNVSPPSDVRSFTVDLMRPEAPPVSVPGLVNSEHPVIAGTAEPGSTVTLLIDGTVVGTTVASQAGLWVFAPMTALSEGIHKVEATITDLAGNVSLPSTVRNVIVDLTRPEAPTVSVPRVVNTPHPVIAGTAEPGNTVALSLDGSVVGTAIANSEGLWVLIVATVLVEGPHDTEAMATDPAGNVGVPSEAITFIVDFKPPEAPEINPFDAFINNRKPIIGGTAEIGTTVMVWLDEEMAGSVEVTPAGTWNFTPTKELEAGTHQVKATAQDAAGNTSVPSAERSFVVRKSHYGWSCATAPAVPATWALCVLALLIGRHRVPSGERRAEATRGK